jgi:hypothetical protein
MRQNVFSARYDIRMKKQISFERRAGVVSNVAY